MATAKPEDLKEICRVGFRAERIVETSKIIAKGDLDLNEIYNLSREEGKNLLMTLPGVGLRFPIVSYYFAFKKADAFPVDVWVKRVMEHFYLKEETNVKLIGQYGGKAL